MTYTKKLLSESLKKHMQTTPLSKITVNDVVNEYGLNRRTLYYHFHDIYDLLEWTIRTEIREVIGQNKTYETWQKGLLEIFNYLYENRKITFNTYSSVDRNLLEDHLYNGMSNLIMEVINEIEEKSNLDVEYEDKENVSKFYEIILTGLFIDWIKNNMTEDPKKIINNLDKIISGDINKALLKYGKRKPR